MEMPMLFIVELFLQLTFPGAPATQYFPTDSFFPFPLFVLLSIFHRDLTHGLHAMYTTSDVTGPFWPRQDGGQFETQSAEFDGPLQPFAGTAIQKKLQSCFL